MKRWGPPVLTLLGVAIGLAGWWLYATIDSSEPEYSQCGIHALYGDLVQGNAALSYCTEVKDQLFLSLALIALGALTFLAGYFLTIVPRIGRLARRTHTGPWFATSALLVIVLGLTGAGAFGWQKYQDHRELDRRHRAEAALAKLVLPADLSVARSKAGCYRASWLRCLHSDRPPQELQDELTALVHGAPQSGCASSRLFGCSASVRGTIAGYPAIASAYPEIYDSQREAVPKGATRVVVGKRATTLYTLGSNVQIYLLIEE